MISSDTARRPDVSNRARARAAWTMLTGLALLAGADVRAANPAAGSEIYRQYCLGCHSPDGRGSVAGAPDFSRGQGLMTPDASLVRALRTGGRGMPSYEGLLRDQQLLDVVAYLRTLQR